MSRRNKAVPKFGTCNKELLRKAKYLVNDFRAVVAEKSKWKDRSHIIGIDDNSSRIPKDSLALPIAAWIEKNPNWELLWRLARERWEWCVYLQDGCKGFSPDLHWFFTQSEGGMTGMEKVLSGKYDRFTREWAIKNRWQKITE